jgi:hypothetical protein
VNRKFELNSRAIKIGLDETGKALHELPSREDEIFALKT